MKPTASTSAGIALDTCELVSSTLSKAAQLTPVPYLATAAGLALNLIDIVQNFKSNGDAFSQLGKDASEIVSFILTKDPRAKQDVATLPPEYLEHAKELSQTLSDIYKFAEAQTSRNKVLRVFQSKSDVATIHDCRERLKHSVDVFNIKSIMLMQDTLASIQDQLEGIAEQTGRIPLDRQSESSAGSQIGNTDFKKVENQERDSQKHEMENIEREKQKSERERQTFHHDCPPGTYTDPFRRPASPHKEPLSWGYSTNQCLVPMVFPTPFFAVPGLTMSGIPSSSSAFSYIPAGNPDLLYHNGDGYCSSIAEIAMMGSDVSLYANTVVNSNSGNVTVNNINNSNNDNSTIYDYCTKDVQ
ncbi:hypothetical protein C0993_000874 [Termitomyces sp. T159_Od127]|nr:hypothetical protein C0993_000874 [Termitomyces sp. T159_Od127]